MDEIDKIEREEVPAEKSSLPASFDPLKQYLNEISRYPLLTRAEEGDSPIRYSKRKTRMPPGCSYCRT